MWPVVTDKHKCLISLMGKPLIQWTLESLERVGVCEAVVVQSPDRQVETALAGATTLGLKLHFVEQAEPKGMGDALLQAEPLLQERFFVLVPYRFDAENYVLALRQKAQATGAATVLCAQHTDQPWHYGVLALEGDRAVRIVEKPASGQEPSDLRVTGVYLLSKQILADYAQVPQAEYAFEAALQRRIECSDVRVVTFERPSAPLKHPWHLLGVARALLAREVTQTQIDPSAHVDETAVIKGPVYVGPGVKVFEHAVVKGPCYLGAGCVVGTGSLVREHTILEHDALVGAHAEVTRSVLGAKASTHSGFFGDSIFGEGAKAGAGTVTANVRVDRKPIDATVKGQRTATGLTSLGAIVGAHTALGVGALLMPGVLVGAGCLIGPGEVIKGSVPDHARTFKRR